MLVPRRLEEVVIMVPGGHYDRVVARLAVEGLFHVGEPPRGVPGSVDRAYRALLAQASERLSRIAQYFSLAGVEPSTVKVDLEVDSWEGSFKRYLSMYSELDSFYGGLLAAYSRLEAELKELVEAEALLKPFSRVEGDLASAYSSATLDFVAGYVADGEALSRIEGEVAKARGVMVYEDAPGGGWIFAAAVPRGEGRRVASTASALGATLYTPKEGLPGSPRRALEQVASRRRAIASEMERIEGEARSRLGDLRRYYTIVRAFASIFNILSSTVRSGSLYIMRGYVDVRDSRRLRRILAEATGGSYIVASLGVKRGEENIPSKVDLPGFLRPFHRLVEIYGHPRPDEIIPTVFLAVTMPLTFALMFPDAGQGLLVILFALLYVYRVSRDWAYIITVLGAASVVSGLLAGEVFGPIVSEKLGLPKLWERMGWEVPPYALPTYAIDHGLEELARPSL